MKVFTYIKNESLRVPRKNFIELGGLELWKHLIYELNDFEIYIDTDSDEVIQECQSDPTLSSVIAYRRKQEFIDMENEQKLSPALLMIDNFLDEYVTDPNEKIILTHTTSPFLQATTLLSAVEYLDQGYEFVHSVHSVQDFAWKGDNFIPINFNPSVVERTQDLDKIYFSCGAFFCFTKNTFKKYKNRWGLNTFYYPISIIESIEIDNEEDLQFAQIVHRGIDEFN